MDKNILSQNFILQCDSYKLHHYAEYPKDTKKIYSTVVPRKGNKYTNDIVAAGATLTARLLSEVTITMAMIDEAEVEVNQYGYDFNRADWEVIVNEFGGKLPLAVFGVEEGRIVKPNTPILGIVNTDDRFFWLVSYVETVVQRIMWKMTTVATICRSLRKQILAAMVATGADLSMLPYKLHNFGDRGADGPDAALIAAVAHGMIFSGSDCLGANRLIKNLYNTDKAYLSSVDATEHSVMCSHSDTENKDDFGAAVMSVERLEEAVARTKRGVGIPLQSVVIDTFDDERFVSQFLGVVLKDRILASGGVLVARPDSGNPLTKPIQIIALLAEAFGGSWNSMGYFVLHGCVRVIQGDGINQDSIPDILANIVASSFSMDNLTLGMGGGMTHGPGRDEFSFSMKATARYNGKEWINLLKAPKTDSGKTSLSGLVKTRLLDSGEIETYKADDLYELMSTGLGWRLYVYDGDLRYVPTYDDVRIRATMGV